MKKIKLNIFLLLITIVLASCNTSTTDNTNTIYKACYGNSNSSNIINLATGSPGELGLLKELAENYQEINNVKINWQKAGSGKSLQLLNEKKVDIVMVHAPKAEEDAINEGWAKRRDLIGSNTFIIVGPKADPAKIKDAEDVIDAFRKIANTKALFLSRGDNSGTNKKELSIWEQATIQPEGEWYVITNDFMMATLKKANEINGYFMVDNSTWFVGMNNLNNLEVLFEGDPKLINIYHALIRSDISEDSHIYKFAKYLVSKKGQEIIKSYGIKDYGMPLYKNATNDLP